MATSPFYFILSSLGKTVTTLNSTTAANQGIYFEPCEQQYLCFFLVLVLLTYTWSSKCNGFSIDWGLGPRCTSLHMAVSAPVNGQGSEAIYSTSDIQQGAGRLKEEIENKTSSGLTKPTKFDAVALATFSNWDISGDRIHSLNKWSSKRATMSAINCRQQSSWSSNTEFAADQESHLLFQSSRTFQQRWTLCSLWQAGQVAAVQNSTKRLIFDVFLKKFV